MTRAERSRTEDFRLRPAVGDGALGRPRVPLGFDGLAIDPTAFVCSCYPRARGPATRSVYLNTSTFAALAKNLSVEQINLLVCAPDVFGSIAFLLSSVIASWAVRVRGAARARDWWIAAVNLFGSIAFGVSALGAVFLPSPREMLDVSRVNIATFVGAVLFFIGAVLTVPTSD